MMEKSMAISKDADSAASLLGRVESLNWPRIAAELNERGYAQTGPILTPAECEEFIAGYDDSNAFRSLVVMARHGFGRGEYKYYKYPLPRSIAALRQSLYPHLSRVANQWEKAFGKIADYPTDHDKFLARCHAGDQRQPTPLLLKYGEGDYNCLHQDLYGGIVFPLQIALLLSAPEKDFAGGEFVLTEQRPRMQSRVEVVSLTQGEGVIFAVNHRAVKGTRGIYRVSMRHGVSRVRSGRRFTLGIIFHDAK